MKTVRFYRLNEIENSLLTFAVIAAKYQDSWIFCRHKQRTTWEIPGGKREPGEEIQTTAKRELYEETGAIQATFFPIAVYRVAEEKKDSYGMLFYSKIETLSELPYNSEIAEIRFFEILPENLTYPEIQPYLFSHTRNWLEKKENPADSF